MFKLKGEIYIEIQFNKTKIAEAFFCEEIINESPFITFNNVSGCNYDPVAKKYVKEGEPCGSTAYLMSEIHAIKFKM